MTPRAALTSTVLQAPRQAVCRVKDIMHAAESRDGSVVGVLTSRRDIHILTQGLYDVVRFRYPLLGHMYGVWVQNKSQAKSHGDVSAG